MNYGALMPDWKWMGVLLLASCLTSQAQTPPESLAALAGRIAKEAEVAYSQSPYSVISKDYFSRFVRDSAATPQPGEIIINSNWVIDLTSADAPLTRQMSQYLKDFMFRRMGVDLRIVGKDSYKGGPAVRLRLSPNGFTGPESFSLNVGDGVVTLTSPTVEGLRDGVVYLVDQIGFRRAPFLSRGKTTRAPRLSVRLGSVPLGGSYREVVFLGYNAILCSSGSLYDLSDSQALPELIPLQRPGAFPSLRNAAIQPATHGLKTYCMLDLRQRFQENAPLFLAHPGVRGARTWRADGDFVLCTEHPLVKRWLAESIRGVFRKVPELDGIVIIVGGEGFYHCFMRPYGVQVGHTSCPRCESLGADVVVSNLSNLLADAARQVSPKAKVVVWPYSASVWSTDPAQIGFIERLKPGVALLTEIEKDETLLKSGGVSKLLWDYSIDLIGPGKRAQKQIAAGRKAGIPVYLKSEPEFSFEAARLPHLPCLGRWVDRAEALASCGASGAWVFPACRPAYGSSAAEVFKYFWWTPKPSKPRLLEQFSQRLVGSGPAAHLRTAWELTSAAVADCPLLPPYYSGPQYLGPAHPLMLDPTYELPQDFYGYFFFLAESITSEGLRTRPTFTSAPFGNAAVLLPHYRRMELHLRRACQELALAEVKVRPEHRLMFEAEANAIRWFYATARTTANFYEACLLRDQFLAFAQGRQSAWSRSDRLRSLKRLSEIVSDERSNAQAALPLAEKDMRLDFYYGGDHSFPHLAAMIRAKARVLQREQEVTLPELARSCGLPPLPVRRIH